MFISPNVPRTIVFASSRDKDYEEMLQILMTRCQRIVLTAYQNNVRGLSLPDLQVTAQAVARQVTESSAKSNRSAHIAQVLSAARCEGSLATSNALHICK